VRIENERLKQFAKLKFGGLTKLAIALGLSESYFSQYTTNDKLIGIELLNKLHKEYDLSIDWLLTGKGSMLISDKENAEVISTKPEMVGVPYLTMEALEQLQHDITMIKEKIGVYEK